MQLSILVPTNRHNLLAYSRIAQACSWAGPDIEVVIRDNSGNAQKREMLAHLRRDNCNILIVDPCKPLENFRETIRAAKGEFVFTLADDDFGFDRAVKAIPATIRQFGGDSSIAGVTGQYVVESSKGASILNYQDVDANDAQTRLAGYLKFTGPNILLFSAVRREMALRVFNAMTAIPFESSFHDQILCLLYLLNGKFVQMQRLLYLYDVEENWKDNVSAQQTDVGFYQKAGLDPAINRLHWFMCGFEGAALASNSDIVPGYPMAQRQPIMDLWFSTMLYRFNRWHERLTFGSSFADDAEKLCAKLRTTTGPLSLETALTDIVGLIALFSKSRAQAYYDFWFAVLNRSSRESAPPPADRPAFG